MLYTSYNYFLINVLRHLNYIDQSLQNSDHPDIKYDTVASSGTRSYNRSLQSLGGGSGKQASLHIT